MLWLWEQLARRADRVGDPALCQGTTRITAPAEAAPRAAVLGLLGSKSLRPGQSRTIDLGDLTLRLRNRGTGLTAGVVAAHAVGRPLRRKTDERGHKKTPPISPPQGSDPLPSPPPTTA
ncbi:TIGR02679 domain-containing protein, partial [Streptomyces sp. NPDC059957]|uniref:TIGR02679 domain-containing protein n=1 Tax=Streptomyces sp. NPDC059957 TaxID=3347016 RepID=UPI00364FA70F